MLLLTNRLFILFMLVLFSASAPILRGQDAAQVFTVVLLDEQGLIAPAEAQALQDALVGLVPSLGYRLKHLAASELTAAGAMDGVDAVILVGSQYPLEVHEVLRDYVTAQGGALWHLGPAPLGLTPMVRTSDGWTPAAREQWPLMSLDDCVLRVATIEKPLAVQGNSIALTSAGKEYFKNVALPDGDYAITTTEDSTQQIHIPPSGQFTPLVECLYTSRNWIFLERTFVGTPAFLIQHRSPEMSVARVLCTWLPWRNSSIDPSDKTFEPFVRSSLRLLVEQRPVLEASVAPRRMRGVAGEVLEAEVRIWNRRKTPFLQPISLSLVVQGAAAASAQWQGEIAASAFSQQKLSLAVPVGTKGLGRLRLKAAGKVLDDQPVVIFDQPDFDHVTRETFFNSSAGVRSVDGFEGPSGDLDVYAAKLDASGYQGGHYSVPWRPDWEQPFDEAELDRVVNALTSRQKHVILDAYALSYRAPWEQTLDENNESGRFSMVHPRNVEQYPQVWAKIARQVKDNPGVIAFCPTPGTGAAFFEVDYSEEGKKAFRAFLQNELKLTLEQAAARYGQALRSWDQIDPPRPVKNVPAQTNPKWRDYFLCWEYSYRTLMSRTIAAIRAEIPDMPCLLRGGLDNSVGNFELASRFKGVAVYCECIETSIDSESYLRGFAQTYGVPISGENGWPKTLDMALRQNVACHLLGGYSSFSHAFGGARYLVGGREDHLEMAAFDALLAGSTIVPPAMTLLLGDASGYHRAEGESSRIEYNTEKLGVNAALVSSELFRTPPTQVLMDDGSCQFLPQETIDGIVKFVNEGGTFVAYATTGRLATHGKTDACWKAMLGRDDIAIDRGTIRLNYKLDVPTQMIKGFKGKTLAVMRQDTTEAPLAISMERGKGRVILLPFAPGAAGVAEHLGAYREILDALDVQPMARIDPPMPCAIRQKGQQRFLIVFDKRPDVIGTYFNEHYYWKLSESLKPQKVRIKAPAHVEALRDQRDGKILKPRGGWFEFQMKPQVVYVFEMQGRAAAAAP